MTDHDPADILTWLAFRYVSREMTAEESADFESRLDTDQEAREAVAEAVSVVVALAASPRPRATISYRRRVLISVATAACLLLASGTWLVTRTVPNTTDRPAPASVAITWSGLRQDAEADRHELYAWLDEVSADATTDETEDSGEAPPAWMIDAASPGKAEPHSPGL